LSEPLPGREEAGNGAVDCGRAPPALKSQGARPGFARQVPSARHPEGKFQGAWLAWLPTKLCLANDPFAVAPASLAGLVRPGIKEIEKVSHG
jgi:hypothetical protein